MRQVLMKICMRFVRNFFAIKTIFNKNLVNERLKSENSLQSNN